MKEVLNIVINWGTKLRIYWMLRKMILCNLWFFLGFIILGKYSAWLSCYTWYLRHNMHECSSKSNWCLGWWWFELVFDHVDLIRKWFLSKAKKISLLENVFECKVCLTRIHYRVRQIYITGAKCKIFKLEYFCF